ncbi:hypothetical protein BDV32DRAFT_149169 [Aspergillus pseudonomiae]|uniref:Serine hydrolase domain-containing protein n=1 Tax=Aspergillus pseudonomiae TaxID=1506151 RepID=A0A5N7DJV7_9EURO|nr:uncharacterized protein BDV37DRAFT_280890 [Aspergillus pseudonomiae]KAB8260733.1 hypothetical protein BDV32DRAFT_149169 [Aspergillus pseudonomiae]KAE8406293.1 hypothetical protein BDV37DRAFT_280890 [Aspergillus pseudonomiae]
MTSAAAIRYELSDQHTYEFVEGAIPWKASNQDAVHSDEATFTCCDPYQADSCLRAIHDLDRFFEDESPFDGMIGFSLGACLTITWLKHKQEALEMGEIARLPVQVVILFGASHVYDYTMLEKGSTVGLNPSHLGLRLDVPSVHIWGLLDPLKSLAQRTTEFFNPERLSIYVHEKGHVITSSIEEVVCVVKAINRAIGAICRE